MHYKLTLSYDGSAYFGWQKTPEGLSIETLLEKALFTLLQQELKLEAASRTDRGVHAREQVISFHFNESLDKNDMTYRLNRILPTDIKILQLDTVDHGFHPSIDAKSKTYEYFISNEPFQSPFERHYHWHVYGFLSLPLMEEAISHLIGKKDFACFCNDPAKQDEDTVREIFDIQIHQSQQKYIIDVTGNRFLYKMVRNIVGTLIYIGLGKLDIPTFLESMARKDRTKLGITAPAHALFLKKINY